MAAGAFGRARNYGLTAPGVGGEFFIGKGSHDLSVLMNVSPIHDTTISAERYNIVWVKDIVDWLNDQHMKEDKTKTTNNNKQSTLTTRRQFRARYCD